MPDFVKRLRGELLATGVLGGIFGAVFASLLTLGFAQTGTVGTTTGTGSIGRYPNLNLHGKLTTVTGEVVDIPSVRLRTTGTPSTWFGPGLLFEGDNAASENEAIGRITAFWDAATNGAENSRMGFSLRVGGAALPANPDATFVFSDPVGTGPIFYSENTMLIRTGGGGTGCLECNNSGDNNLVTVGNNAGVSVDVSGVAVGRPSLATNTTQGFVYFPAMAGNPTGDPDDKTGFGAVVINTTDDEICWSDDNDTGWLCVAGATP